MKGLEDFIDEVENNGSVIDLSGGAITLADMDSMIHMLEKYSGVKENIIYANDRLIWKLANMLEQVNAHGVAGTYINEFKGAFSFLPELYFLRGSYEFVVIKADIDGGVLIPTDHFTHDKLVRKSIKILT